jgi:Spy/CpxP family protein refolding chaperone
VTKSKAVILALFVVTLGAGASAGMLYERHDQACCSRSTQQMVHELKLTPEQQQKFFEAMTPVSNAHRLRRTRKDELVKEMNAATQTLLTPEQKQKFAEIQKKYEDQVAQLDDNIKRAEDEAVKATGSFLTEEQRAKYIEFRKTHFDVDPSSKPK